MGMYCWPMLFHFLPFFFFFFLSDAPVVAPAPPAPAVAVCPVPDAAPVPVAASFAPAPATVAVAVADTAAAGAGSASCKGLLDPAIANIIALLNTSNRPKIADDLVLNLIVVTSSVTFNVRLC